MRRRTAGKPAPPGGPRKRPASRAADSFARRIGIPLASGVISSVADTLGTVNDVAVTVTTLGLDGAQWSVILWGHAENAGLGRSSRTLGVGRCAPGRPDRGRLSGGRRR